MRWPEDRRPRVIAEYPTCEDPRALALDLGVTYRQLLCAAKRYGVRRRNPLTEEEEALVRRMHAEGRYCREIAAALGRALSNAHQIVQRLGLSKPKTTILMSGGQHDAELRQLLADGLSDTDIASTLGCERHTVSKRRKELKLPGNAQGERFRQKQREGTRRQLAAAGCRNLGELRRVSYGRFALENGWPGDLRPRHVQVLNVLAREGVPLSRRQLCEAIGLRTDRGQRSYLASNDREGSYVAHLIGRGLLIALKNTGERPKPSGKGSRRVTTYTLGPEALRILQARALEEATHGEQSDQTGCRVRGAEERGQQHGESVVEAG